MRDESGGKAAEQLAAIESLGRALGDAGIEYWLFGGWAVDFWVGRVTPSGFDGVTIAGAVSRQEALHGYRPSRWGSLRTPVGYARMR
jgi:hypothetical protein